ncbi:MAG TPA: hypothetical protein VFJ16_29675 [Longimicrobium sp.]|nr:hypothetical protein [Longimicrobium sp.]
MKKVKMDLDELRVESFAAGFPEPPGKGTVEAHGTGANQNTCWNTCPYTCSHEIACFNTT